MFKAKPPQHGRLRDCRLRLAQGRRRLGSLLLGVTTPGAICTTSAWCAVVKATFRRELVDELGPCADDALETHPVGAGAERSGDGACPAA